MQTAAPPQAPTTADATSHQVYVMHCLPTDSVDRRPGFSIRATSTRDAAVMQELFNYAQYLSPVKMRGKVATETEAPWRLALLRLANRHYATLHTAYMLKDTRDRDGSYITHALISPTADMAHTLRLWGSNAWAKNYAIGAPQTIPPLAGAFPVGPLIHDDALHAFLTAPAPAADAPLASRVFPSRLRDAAARQALVRQFIRAVRLVADAPEAAPRRRVFVVAEPGLVAMLLYAAARLMPELRARPVTFSTYENLATFTEVQKKAQVIGVYTGDDAQGINADYFTHDGYGIDTYSGAVSAELRGGEPAAQEIFIERALKNDWEWIDDVFGLIGIERFAGPLPDRIGEDREAWTRVRTGIGTASDLRQIARHAGGSRLLREPRYEAKVWPTIYANCLAAGTRDPSRAEFADVIRAHRPDIVRELAEAIGRDNATLWNRVWGLADEVMAGPTEDAGKLFLDAVGRAGPAKLRAVQAMRPKLLHLYEKHAGAPAPSKVWPAEADALLAPRDLEAWNAVKDSALGAAFKARAMVLVLADPATRPAAWAWLRGAGDVAWSAFREESKRANLDDQLVWGAVNEGGIRDTKFLQRFADYFEVSDRADPLRRAIADELARKSPDWEERWAMLKAVRPAARHRDELIAVLNRVGDDAVGQLPVAIGKSILGEWAAGSAGGESVPACLAALWRQPANAKALYDDLAPPKFPSGCRAALLYDGLATPVDRDWAVGKLGQLETKERIDICLHFAKQPEWVRVVRPLVFEGKLPVEPFRDQLLADVSAIETVLERGLALGESTRGVELFATLLPGEAGRASMLRVTRKAVAAWPVTSRAALLRMWQKLGGPLPLEAEALLRVGSPKELSELIQSLKNAELSVRALRFGLTRPETASLAAEHLRQWKEDHIWQAFRAELATMDAAEQSAAVAEIMRDVADGKLRQSLLTRFVGGGWQVKKPGIIADVIASWDFTSTDEWHKFWEADEKLRAVLECDPAPRIADQVVGWAATFLKAGTVLPEAGERRKLTWVKALRDQAGEQLSAGVRDRIEAFEQMVAHFDAPAASTLKTPADITAVAKRTEIERTEFLKCFTEWSLDKDINLSHIEPLWEVFITYLPEKTAAQDRESYYAAMFKEWFKLLIRRNFVGNESQRLVCFDQIPQEDWPPLIDRLHTGKDKGAITPSEYQQLTAILAESQHAQQKAEDKAESVVRWKKRRKQLLRKGGPFVAILMLLAVGGYFALRSIGNATVASTGPEETKTTISPTKTEPPKTPPGSFRFKEESRKAIAGAIVEVSERKLPFESELRAAARGAVVPARPFANVSRKAVLGAMGAKMQAKSYHDVIRDAATGAFNAVPKP